MGRDKGKGKQPAPAQPEPAKDAGGKKKNAPRREQKGKEPNVVTSKVKERVIEQAAGDGKEKVAIVIKDWQRLPKQMLMEWTQKEKRPKPNYGSARSDAAGSFRSRVTLPDPKKKEKDMIFWLGESCPDPQDAQHKVALVALHGINPKLPLERKLPDPYREYWLNMAQSGPIKAPEIIREEKKEMRVEKEKERKEKEKAREKRQMALQQLGMSDESRHLIQQILQSIGGEGGSAPVPGEGEPKKSKELFRPLKALGFEADDINEALKVASTKEDAIDWLCLNIPEERLPQKFKPDRGIEVVSFSKPQAKLAQRELQNAFPSPLLAAVGCSLDEATQAADKADRSSDGKASDHLRLLALWKDVYCKQQSDDEGAAASEEELEEELGAMEAIFATDATVLREDSIVSVTVKVEIDGFPPSSVVMIVDKSSAYPHVPPCAVISSRGSTAQVCRAVNQALSEFVQSHEPEAMMFDVVTWVQTTAPDISVSVATQALSLGDPPSSTSSVACSKSTQETAKGDGKDRSSGKNATAQKLLSMQELKAMHSRVNPKSSQQKGRRQGKSESGQFRSELSKNLLSHWEEYQKSPTHKFMRDTRTKLPAFKNRQEILQKVEKNQVLIISGDTGCGKTTQIPQFCLEKFVEDGNGGECKIICTQPRRLAATGVAERVAQERGEVCGGHVGYRVRFDSKMSDKTRLMFCTTGILLRIVQDDPTLWDATHIIVDEVHERSLETDLLLCLLREISRSKNMKCPKLILMSATLNSELFGRYFGNAPSVSIPGRTFPVQDFFLPDVLDKCSFSVRGKVRKEFKAGEDGIPPLPPSFANYSEAVQESLKRVDEGALQYDIMVALISEIYMGPPGAILVFMPGVAEIDRLRNRLLDKELFKGKQRDWVVPLHASLTNDKQRKVFQRAPNGLRKIVISTNIAETSLTVDDVVYVVDSGRMKEMRYDPDHKMSCLVDTFVSKASAKQRRGRAGRVQEGICYKMYTEECHGRFSAQQTPEVKRVPLEHTCLTIKAMFGRRDVRDVLKKCIEPPSDDAIDTAMNTLKVISAVDEGDQLTPLGRHLSQMPTDVRIGKMIIYGALLQCIDPILTVAATLSHSKSPFIRPPDEAEEADSAHKLFQVHQSDHMTLLNAYEQWDNARKNRSQDKFCRQNYISNSAMMTISDLRRDLKDWMFNLGFLGGNARCEANAQSGEPNIIKAAICAGLNPNIAKVKVPENTYHQVSAGTVANPIKSKDVKLYLKDEGRVFLHPSSCLFSCQDYDNLWLVFSEKVSTSKIFLRGCSTIHPFALLLFGGNVQVRHDQQVVTVDEWVGFRSPAKVAVLGREIRNQLSTVLDIKISAPELDISSTAVVHAAIHLLKSNFK